MEKTWKVAGISFDHPHMQDNLRMVCEHPRAKIVGLCDDRPKQMRDAASDFHVPDDVLFTNVAECIERTRPDIVLLCPATVRHRELVEKVARLGVHVILEKPFALNLHDADAMIAAMQASGKLFAVNWPMAWYPGNGTAKRLIDEGLIGAVREVHYYDGNRGPKFHLPIEDGAETDSESNRRGRWFYDKSAGGGALLDYLGYGMTLGTWFRGDNLPLEMTAVVHYPPGSEVDQHCVAIAHYSDGLSKFEARWGTFTDPWVTQPQPKCGFVIVGDHGTISTYDLEPTIRVQTREHPSARDILVDEISPPYQNPIQNVIHCLETAEPLHGPLTPQLGRIGQMLVDCAASSARLKRTIAVDMRHG